MIFAIKKKQFNASSFKEWHSAMLQRNIKVLGINPKYLSYYENHTLHLLLIIDHWNNIFLLKTAWFKKLKLRVFNFLHILEKMFASAPFNAFVVLVGLFNLPKHFGSPIVHRFRLLVRPFVRKLLTFFTCSLKQVGKI